jgi:hypothetical protein
MANSFLDSLVDLGIDSASTAAAGAAKAAPDAVFNALLGQESGGRQFDKAGKPITSKAGAIGIAQVMPGTAPEAARLAGVEFDEVRYRNDAEYNKLLGRAYYQKQLEDFGDTAKALAAYNAGPAAVRSAVDRATKAGDPNAWLTMLPRETRDYVPSVMARAGKTSGGSSTEFSPAPNTQLVGGNAKTAESATLGDYVKEFGASAVDSVGSIGQFIGEGMAAVANSATGTEQYEGKNLLKPASDALRNSMTEGGKQAREDATVKGDVAKVLEGDTSSVELPDSAQGWGMLLVNGLGSLSTMLIPVVGQAGRVSKLSGALKAAKEAGDAAKVAQLATELKSAQRAMSVLGASTNAAVTGGAAAGDVRESLREQMSGMTHEQLLAEVPAYAEAFQATGDEQAARDSVINSSARWAGAISSVAGAAGGAFNAKVIEGIILKRGVSRALGSVSGSLPVRTAVGAAGGAIMEGGQETSEKVGQNIGENIGQGKPALENATRDTLGDFIGGAAVGKATGGVAGALSSPPVKPAAPKPVQDKAAEGNSPLSSAAVAGVDAMPPVQPQPEPETPVDPIAERLAPLEQQIRDLGVLRTLRSDESPYQPKQFLNDLAIVRSGSTAAATREQALGRIELAIDWAKENAPEPPVTPVVPELGAIENALNDRDLRLQMSEPDRRSLVELAAQARDPAIPAATRGDFARQAFEIIGRYSAPTQAPIDAPAAPAQAAGPSAALLTRPVPPAPTVGTTPEGQAASDAAAARLQGLETEDGQAGDPAPGRMPARSVAPAGTAADAAQLRLDQLAQEESLPPVDDFALPAGQQTVAPATEAPAAEAPAVETPAPFEQIAAPQVAIPPAAPGDTAPAFRRKRMAMLGQLASLGFDRVERREDGFFFINPTKRQEFKLDGMADSQFARRAVADFINTRAQTAATSPLNDTPQPTEGQAKAGQYAKGDVTFDGLKVAVENPVGSTRSGTAPDGTKWSVDMKAHYGFVRRTEGADGDQVDVYLPENARPGSPVFVFDQYKDDGSFDEHKVVLGVADQAAAERIYDQHFSDGSGPRRRKAMKAMTMEEFKSWLKTDRTKSQAAVEDVARTVAPDLAPGVEILKVGGKPLFVADESKFPEQPAGATEGRRAITKSQARLIRGVAGLFNKKVVFFNGTSDDGFVRPSLPDTIYLNESSSVSPLAVFGHELVHLMKVEAPHAYRAVADVVRARVSNAKGFRDDYFGKYVLADESGKQVASFRLASEANAALQKLPGGKILEQPDIDLNDSELEELVSDLNGDQMRSGNFWSDVFTRIQQDAGPKAPSVIAKVVATVQEMLNRLTEMFQGQRGFNAERFVRDTDAIRGALRDGMARYMKQTNTSSTKLAADVQRAKAEIKKSTMRAEAPDVFRKIMERAGYDAIARTNENLRDAGKYREIAVLSPTQVKSAIGNNGQFDPANPDIRKSTERAEAPSPEFGIHFSRQPRAALNGAFYGQGLKGLEAERLRETTDGRLKSRVYFYIDEGQGVRPEAGVGGVAHQVKLPKLYDAKADPLKLWNGADINGTESAILDAGFDGYWVKNHPTGQGIGVVIGKASTNMPAETVPTPAVPVPPKAVPQDLKRGLMSAEMQRVDVTSIPGARLRSGTLIVPETSRDQANAEMERIGSSIRFSPVRGEDVQRAASEYAQVEAQYRNTDQWMKAPNGQPTKLSERQWVQVRTPSFKQWFGDWEKFAGVEGGVWSDARGEVSKAVDENGEPLVVYHGTETGGFAEFKRPTGDRRGELGIFASADYGMARSYARRGRAKDFTAEDLENYEEGGRNVGIYALFVNLRNPSEEDFDGANWSGSREHQNIVLDANGEHYYAEDGRGHFETDEATKIADEIGGTVEAPDDHYTTTDGVVREARRYNNDGAIIRSVIDDGGGPGYSGLPGNVFVAFDPNQVKSADFNGGTFSVSSDDIRLSVDRSAADENRMSVVVGGKPGEFGWNFTRNDLTPPPIQAPAVFGPRLEKIGPAVQKILSSKKFAELADSALGIKGLRVVPIQGSWLGNPEPSYALVADSMTYDQATQLSKLLGFAFAQDATVVYKPSPEDDMAGTPAAYVGNDTKLTKKQLDKVIEAARAAGLDYSTTQDGRAVKFLYFGPGEQYLDFIDQVWDIQQSAGLKYSDLFFVRSDLNEANTYVQAGDGSGSPAAWLSDREPGPSSLFRRAVDALVVPYAKAVGAEGYRFAVQRFADKFGLSDAQRELIRDALIPRSGRSKSTVSIASGEEKLDITPTGANGKVTVSDILWALQNRSAQAGLIEPGDYSERAKKVIAEAIAEEVIFHLQSPRGGKSAIGWYDRALKAAKKDYQSIFPELATDPDAEMLFDAIWGITSQGNDVFSNSVYGARVYNLVRNGQMTLPNAVRILRGTFGGETRAIENNLLKLHDLINRNGYDAMRRFFNTKGRVGDINKRLREDKTLYYSGSPLQVEGKSDQIVTGWMVFGPKIGSFINNLHGDYSTLTADLWFSRSWNRILGYSFVHAPALEADQYQKFISALVAEYNHVNGTLVGPVQPKSVRGDAAVMPEFGPDLEGMTREQIEEILDNPYKALEFAAKLEEDFRKGGYKLKSDMRRAGKVWVEGREGAVAAPRTDLERSFQQDTAEAAQKIIRRKTGQTITIADIQAALWFYEKDDLFGPLGGTNKKSEGADYAGAADQLLLTFKRGNLYLNKTDNVYVFGNRGSYLPGFDPAAVNDAAALQADYDAAPVAGASFNLEDDGADIAITGTKNLEADPQLFRTTVRRVADLARARGVRLLIEPKTPRNWKARARIEQVLTGLGFGPDVDGVWSSDAGSAAASGIQPRSVVDDDGDIPGAKYAEFDDEAHIRYGRDKNGNIRIQAITSSKAVRGRDMLRWLQEEYLSDVLVDEVTEPAAAFFDRMQDEGLIGGWSEKRFRGKYIPVSEAGTTAGPEGDIKFSPRRGEPPKKTVKAYKLFRVDAKKPGQLFPLFVSANEPVKMGAWLDAEVGQQAEPTKTGKPQVKSKLGPLALRPGWHAGDLPIATHIGSNPAPRFDEESGKVKTLPSVRPANQVWAEIEMAADRDWQAEAEKRAVPYKITNPATGAVKGQPNPATAHITDQVPVDGFYRYKTNPNMTGNWLIGGSMKVTRVLSDDEVAAINKAAGVADLPRAQPFDAKKYGFDTKASPARDVTGTEEFRRWFGESVMTENGEPGGKPLVLYHGGFDFASASEGKSVPKVGSRGALGVGFYMTPDLEIAEDYANVGSTQGGKVNKLYARVTRPLEIGKDGKDAYDPAVDALVQLGVAREKAQRMAENAYEKYGYLGSEIKKRAIEQGYDGIAKYNNGKLTEVVVWSAPQIKSATDNNGRFSWNPDIRRSPERDQNFTAWTGGHTVVPAEVASLYKFETGSPVVVEGFHGTKRDFDRVDTAISSAGYFLSSKPLVADEYAGVYEEARNKALQPGGNVQRQYVRMDNPLVINARGASFNRIDTRGVPGYGLPMSNTDMINQWAKQQGYDGIIYKDLRDSISRPDGRGATPSNVYVSFKPTYVKSAIGNSGAFSLDNESFLRSPERSPLGYVSALARGIDAMQTKQAPAGAWKAQIKGLINKGIAKAEEIEWSGINDWLDLQQGKVSKEAVAEYLERGGVQVEEVVLGGPRGLPEILSRHFENSSRRQPTTTDGWIAEAEREERIARQFRARGDTERANRMFSIAEAMNEYAEQGETGALGTKYSQYTLPGGENYREVLLTLPVKRDEREIGREEAIKLSADESRFVYARYPLDDGDIETERMLSPGEFDGVTPSARFYEMPGGIDSAQEGAYRSTHWDQPNVLAHIRVNDRTDADGKRVLFVEELQSDWGQEGKKKGFASESDVKPVSRKEYDAFADKLLDDYIEQRVQAGESREEAGRRGINMPFPQMAQELGRGDEYARMRAGRDLDMEGGSDKIPAAPFVTKTEGWLNLALKRVMVMAAEGGYDRVAFVNGEQSADRYDLSQQLDEVLYDRKSAGGGVIIGRKDGSNAVTRDVASDDDVADVVGKELAQRLIDAPKNEYGMHRIAGLDLKVGGEGMKTFYDTIVPTALKKLLPKVGGGQMSEVRVGISTDTAGYDPSNVWIMDERDSGLMAYRTRAEAERMLPSIQGMYPQKKLRIVESNPDTSLRAQPGFDVTDAMREKVAEGLPLFSRERVTDTPEFKAWFGDSKVVDADGKPLVVYHGTSGDFSVFDFDRVRRADELGVFTSASPDVASSYGEGGSVMPLYLAIRKPYFMDNDERMMIQVFGSEYDEEGTTGFVNGLKKSGYDGIYVPGDPNGDTEEEQNDQWIAFYPEQIKSAIGNRGTFDPADPDIRRSTGRTATGAVWDSPSASKWDDFVYKAQDKLVDVKRVVESLREASGAIADDLNVYLQEELYHGRAAKRTEDFVNMELTPLLEQLSKDGLSMADLEEFLHARHAKEANEAIAKRNPGNPDFQDGGSGMETGEAQNYLATLPADLRTKLEAAAAKVDGIIEQTRQLYVDYELESQATVDGWKNAYQHYIPLMREDKDGSPGLGQGFSIKGREVKGRTGSKRKVVDILANVAIQREKAIVRGEKNRVSQALIGLAQSNPNPDFWTVDQVPTERVFDPATGLVKDQPDPLYKSRANAVVAKIADANGVVREHAVVFNEDDPRALRMAGALKNLDAGDLEGLLGVSAKISRYFASVNTQWNPVFGVVNLVRDVQSAVLNLSSTPLKDVDKRKFGLDTLSALRGVYADARAARKGRNPGSQWARLWDEFQEVGGQTGYRELFRTSSDRAKAIEKALNPDAWMDSGLGKIFTAGGALKVPLSVAMKGARWLFDWIGDYNLAFENGVRLAAYKAGLDKGLSKEQAASVAKNLTVNFNRKGQVSQQAGALYAFFNASVQGTARMGQTLFTMEPGKPKTLRLSAAGKKIVYGGMMLGSMQALALAAAGFNDDDPPEFVRERSLIIPVGGGKYVTIPMPLGFHVLPGIGRVATEFALSGFKDPHKRALSLASLFAETFNPIGNAGLSMQTLAPTALDPLVALAENRDWTGRPIARESSNKAIPGSALGRDTATSLAKTVSEAVNTLSGGNKYVAGVFSPTPDQIDYLIGQLTGGVGRELSKVEQTVLSTARGEALPTYKVPLLGRFVGDTKSQASEGTAFYANTDRLNELETEIKGLQKDGKNAEANALRRERSEAYLITAASRAERQIQRLRLDKRELIKQGAPREQVKAIEDRITETMARLNRQMEALQQRQ